MDNKNYQIIYLLSLLFFLAIESGGVSAAEPTLNSVNPNQAPPEYEVTISGLSYSNGSEIVFYKGITEQLRVAAVPPLTFTADSSLITKDIDPTSTEFKFIVPSLPPGLYNIRLEHIAKLGTSNSLPFIILPVVNKILINAGNHLSGFEIRGRGFNNTEQENLAYLHPTLQPIKARAIPYQMIASIPSNAPPQVVGNLNITLTQVLQ